MADREFPDLPGGGRMRVTRSRSNYGTEHSGPDWNNIHPDHLAQLGEIVPDCAADLNGDDMVAVTDLLSLLAAWDNAGGFQPADFEPTGGDGAVDVLDLLQVLASLGPCP